MFVFPLDLHVHQPLYQTAAAIPANLPSKLPVTAKQFHESVTFAMSRRWLTWRQRSERTSRRILFDEIIQCFLLHVSRPWGSSNMKEDCKPQAPAQAAIELLT